jgi:hypothetical protein
MPPMDVTEQETESRLTLIPKFDLRDCIPILGLAGALCISMGVFTFSVFGLGWSLLRREWLGSCVSVVFALGSGWLIRLGLPALLNSLPRQIAFCKSSDSLEMNRLFLRTTLNRDSLRKMWIRVEVCKGGFKRGPGKWLYLAVEDNKGKHWSFLLGTLHSFALAERRSIRQLYLRFCRYCQIQPNPIEVLEI